MWQVYSPVSCALPLVVLTTLMRWDLLRVKSAGSVTSTGSSAPRVKWWQALFKRARPLSLEEWAIPREAVIMGPKIGSGSFGTVYRGHWHGSSHGSKGFRCLCLWVQIEGHLLSLVHLHGSLPMFFRREAEALHPTGLLDGVWLSARGAVLVGGLVTFIRREGCRLPCSSLLTGLPGWVSSRAPLVHCSPT